MKTRTLIAIPPMMGLVLLTMGCAPDLSFGPEGSIEVSPKNATLTAIGATVQFYAREGGRTFGKVWYSTEQDVATVEESSGLATAVANGSTSICTHTGGFLGAKQGCATLTVAIP